MNAALAASAFSEFFQKVVAHAPFLDEFADNIVMDLIYLAVFLGIGTVIKNSLPFLKKFLIPNSIIAGFVGLLLGPELLGLFDFSVPRLENLIYHLMTIGFAALALKEREPGRSRMAGRSGMFIVSTYMVQAALGLALTLGFIYVVGQNLFPTFGFFLPLGYGQGPGQALSIGKQWEDLGATYPGMGFDGGANTGLFFATMGYLWACFGGIFYVNWLIRTKRAASRVGEAKSGERHQEVVVEKDAADESPMSESVDRLTVQVVLIGVVYLATYLTLYALDFLLRGQFGTFGTTIANMFQGFAFIFGSVYGLLARMILDKLRAKGIVKQNHPNNYLLQRISGISFDFMVTAAVAIMSFTAIAKYWLPTAVIGIAGGLVTIWWCTWIGRKVFRKYPLENLAAQYGMLTGTISTGMALLREVDPDFRSDAADNLVLGSGTGLAFGLPLLIVINLPVQGYLKNEPWYYFLTLAIIVVYLIALTVLMTRRRKAKAEKPSKSPS